MNNLRLFNNGKYNSSNFHKYDFPMDDGMNAVYVPQNKGVRFNKPYQEEFFDPASVGVPNHLVPKDQKIKVDYILFSPFDIKPSDKPVPITDYPLTSTAVTFLQGHLPITKTRTKRQRKRVNHPHHRNPKYLTPLHPTLILNGTGLRMMTTTPETILHPKIDEALQLHQVTNDTAREAVNPPQTPLPDNKEKASAERKDEITEKNPRKTQVQAARVTVEEQGWVSHWIGNTPVRHKPTPLRRPTSDARDPVPVPNPVGFFNPSPEKSRFRDFLKIPKNPGPRLNFGTGSGFFEMIVVIENR